MIPLIITLIIWTLFNTFLSITAILGGFNNHKECALLLDALDKIGEEAQKRQLKMSTVTNPCEVDTVPTNDLVYRPKGGDSE